MIGQKRGGGGSALVYIHPRFLVYPSLACTTSRIISWESAKSNAIVWVTPAVEVHGQSWCYYGRERATLVLHSTARRRLFVTQQQVGSDSLSIGDAYKYG